MVGGYQVAELYLVQKTHKKKNMDELKTMFVECFDEAAKQVHFHGRDQGVPADTESLVRVLPPTATEIGRVGKDVRTLVYVDLDQQIESFFAFAGRLKDGARLMDELGISTSDAKLLLALFGVDAGALAGRRASFEERSEELGVETWVRILDSITRGYIANRFSRRYHDLLFAIWKLRTLTFCLNEAHSFEEAEENTAKQAAYASHFSALCTP